MHALLEVGDAQRAREARGAAGGQHVVHAGHVVAEHGGRVRTAEHGTGVADLGDEHLGVGAHELQVLGRDRVGDGDRLRRVVDEHEPAARGERGLGLGAPRRSARGGAASCASTASANRSLQVITTATPPGPCSACASRSAATHSGFVESSAITASSDSAGERLDAHDALHLALGRGDVAVARSDDHVDRRGSTPCRTPSPRSARASSPGAAGTSHAATVSEIPDVAATTLRQYRGGSGARIHAKPHSPTA